MPHTGPRNPTQNEITEWVAWMEILLKGLRAGQQYVYLDGWMIAASSTSVHIDGWHSRHDFDFVPHVSASAGERPVAEILGSTNYWQSTHIANEDD
ncbi:MAG TPA: hypothetical protein VG734_22660 [Lacunisphaera sp.]|nr:hypothetical protein [Lacunisphaera sp.]